MSVSNQMQNYLRDTSGAITVDWTVLSAAAVGLAIATTAIMTDTIAVLSSRMDNELRSRQLSDEFVQFIPFHFEPILQTGLFSQDQLEGLYNIASDLLNHDIISRVAAGVTGLENGTLTSEEIVQLVAVASVASQRNLVDDGTLNHYFGFDGRTPFYATVANAPSGADSN